jgi:feruloyl esterase
MLTLQGLASPNVPPSDTKNYYARTSALLGGFEKTQEFHRLYLVPGMANCGGVGSVNGLPGVSPPANPPLPTQDQIFDALVEWVEHGKAPTSIVLSNRDGSISRPVCMYPQSLVYLGGDVNSAASYACVQR